LDSALRATNTSFVKLCAHFGLSRAERLLAASGAEKLGSTSLQYEKRAREVNPIAGEGRVMWRRVYDPFGNRDLSTLVACLPIVSLLGLVAFTKVNAHFAASIALGLTFAKTSFLYLFFGWLGVALTASETAANELFGGLQKVKRVAAQPFAVLMAAPPILVCAPCHAGLCFPLQEGAPC
jgi:L-lactate permease